MTIAVLSNTHAHCQDGSLDSTCKTCNWLPNQTHGDVMTWRCFQCYWPFMGNPTVNGGFPSQRISNEFWNYFVVILNKQLNKNIFCRWFETSWCSCDAIVSVCAHINHFPVATAQIQIGQIHSTVFGDPIMAIVHSLGIYRQLLSNCSFWADWLCFVLGAYFQYTCNSRRK